jgi:hypothetical protein
MNRKLLHTILICGFISSQVSGQVSKVRPGSSYKIEPYYIGVNGNVGTQHMPWNNQELLTGFVNSGARSIRYPAGTIANTWDWDKGWIDSTVPDSLLINWVRSEGWKNFKISYPLENFKKAIDATGAEPVYVLNMLSKDLEHSLRGLRKAKALGLPVRYVEMGNELYFNLRFEMQRFPTPEAYGKTCFEWITAIKREFPEARCAVVSWEMVRSERHKNWTSRVLQHATNADAVIFHAYTPFGIDNATERANNQAGEEGLTVGGVLDKDPSVRQSQELTLLKEPKIFNKMILTALEVANRHKKMSVPADKRIWATEFNSRSDNSSVRGTWANTLFISAFYLAFLENPQVEITHYHNIIGPLFATFFTNKNGFNHLLNTKIASKPGTLTAGGFAMNAFARATNLGGMATRLEFENNAVLIKNDENVLHTLYGWSVLNGNKGKAILINFSSEQKAVSLSEVMKGWKYTHYTAPLEHYVMSDQGLTKRSGEIKDTLNLSPYSITILEK